MTLKRLDLFGFKTFAERTEVEFPVGVTAVVGPNGSGKSNVSDAILWVLGESNVRHLRGDRAQDVIFAGTGVRKPLGMAEASLTFDNSDGRLALPDPEVTVTRRVYRNGEGEYFINRAPCRLRDIHDLFLDTGIGRDAYNMVGQSDIDSILSARPEERRQLFEEAAGIKKYRVRKNEAVRKLENTSANLVRVTDILAEIDRSVGPLERAAGIAREFRGLDSRRQELEQLVFAHDAERLSNDLISLRDDAELLGDETEAARAARAEAEAREATARLRLTELEREVENARTVLEERRAEKTRREAERTVLSQRREDAARREVELSEAIVALEARLDEAVREHEESVALASSLAEQAEAQQARLETARAESEAERAVLRKAVERLQTLRSEETRLQTAIATRSGEAKAARAEAERTLDAQAKLTERIAALEAAKSHAESAASEASVRTAELQKAREQIAAAKAAAEEAARTTEAEIAGIQSLLAEKQRKTDSAAARRRALAETAESHEGFFAGVRAVLEASKSGRIAGEFSAVADFIQVPAGLEVALEVALGSHLQDVVCSTDVQARNAIDFLKSENAGRATFLPLDLLEPPSRVNLAQPTEPGGPILGWAADLITCDAIFRPAVEMLLGRVLVVENLEAAVSYLRRDRLPIRLVSLEGEIVTGQGSITGGRGKGGQSQLLTRKREIEDLGAEITLLGAEIENHKSTLETLREKQASFVTAGREGANALNENRIQVLEAERKQQYSTAEAERITRECSTVRVEGEAAAERAAILAQQAVSADALSTEAASALEPIQAEIAALQRAESGPDQARRQALVALEVETVALRERHTAALTAGARAEHLAHTTREELEYRTDQREAARRAAGESTTVDDSLTGILAALDTGIAEASQVLDERREQRDVILTESAIHREQAHAAELRALEIGERTRKLDFRIANLVAEREHILTRLREILMPDTIADAAEEDVEDSEDAVARPVSEEEADRLFEMVEFPVDFSRHSAMVELNRIRRQIAELGPVNPAAEDEFERTSDRQSFLTTQRDDLVQAEETLRRTIREIDESTREVFLKTFERIQVEFDTMFHRLFGGGGVTRLALTDPEDVLETGIEIIVQPPGKKLQNLQLLSGGERALTAAALLFAFLRVKPSPFVVLDEVDAPLDEANVGRFAVALREFSTDSQFIVITHNRGTMESADALYGVTMQEPGISRLLSLRLEERQQDVQRELITA